MVEFRVLGPLEVIGPQGPVRIRSARQRTILALLLLHSGDTVSADRLVDELWGDDPPPSAQHALEVHVSNLRRAIGTERVETQPGGYRLRMEGSEIDLARFEALVADAFTMSTEGHQERAARRLAAALALWRGSALSDLADGGVARAERAHLDELHAVSLERWIDAELACGHHLELLPDLRRTVAEMPLREEISARLMLALYRSGRQSEALDVYQAARATLDRELGVEPGQALEALQRAVLDHDPALDLVATTEPSGRPLRSVGLELPRKGQEDVERHPSRVTARSTVTTLFACMTASSLIGESLDPESAGDPLDRVFGNLRSILERHGATVEQFAGDAVMAVFGVPLTHEDDALRAVRAAAEMRDVVVELNLAYEHELGLRVEMRIGVNTGEVVTGRGSGLPASVRGDAVHLAASLQQTAAPGEILLGESTYDLVRHAVDVGAVESLDIKGQSSPTLAYRLQRATGTGGRRVRLDAPMFGRARELGVLQHAFDSAVADGSCRLFAILGPAGIGKSRLVTEFLGTVGEGARVVRGRCPAYGEGISYWPAAEIVRSAAGIEHSDGSELAKARIAKLAASLPGGAAIVPGLVGIVGLERSAARDEMFWSFRQMLELLAADRPLVVVVEDVHWAEPTLLELLESVADLSRDVPLLLVCVVRTELLDEVPPWPGRRTHTTTIQLDPLDGVAAIALMDSLVPRGALSPERRARIAAAAEGNPLYLEELLLMLTDRGALVAEVGEGSRTLDSLAMPPTIQALLSARLDGLGSQERATAARASVMGRVFDERAVTAISTGESRFDVPRDLASLARKGVIGPERPGVSRHGTFRFRHELMRDAAYERLPKAERAELHELLADWLDRGESDRRSEVDEVIGSHLERSYRYRAELGPPDDRGRDLAERAANRLIGAGGRALARSDMGDAANLLGRAAALLDPADPTRLAILPDLGRALDLNGRHHDARAVFAEAVVRAVEANDERALAHAHVQQYLSSSKEAATNADERHVAQECIAVFDVHDDLRGLAFAWHLYGAASLGTVDGERSLVRAMDYARRAGDHHEETAIVLGLSAEFVQGPTPIPEAIGRCEAIMAGAPGDRAIEMAMAHALAHLRARRGEFGPARQLAARCQAIAAESGQAWRAAFLTEVAWDVETLAGEDEAAERIITDGCRRTEAMGQPNSILEMDLALSQTALGRDVDLDRLVAIAAPQRGWPRALSERTLAVCHLNAGHLADAERHARRAADLFATTSFINHHADALATLGDVLLAMRRREAKSAYQAAVTLYERKGCIVGAQTIARRLASLTPTDSGTF